MIEYLNKVIGPLPLIILKMSGYVKTFKVEDGTNKLKSFCIDRKKLLEKYKAISAKIEDLKNIKLNALSAYNDRYMKTKIRTYSGKF